MSAHDPQARREAAAVPIVLFGDRGRTVEGYRPAAESLAAAAPGAARHHWEPVQGPHLRAVRQRYRTNKTGIVGISTTRLRSRGNRRYLVVNLGPTSRRFCLDTLGESEAWRRAIALRREHLLKLALANAEILAARATASSR
jgi:hypothetical protein